MKMLKRLFISLKHFDYFTYSWKRGVVFPSTVQARELDTGDMGRSKARSARYSYPWGAKLQVLLSAPWRVWESKSDH